MSGERHEIEGRELAGHVPIVGSTRETLQGPPTPPTPESLFGTSPLSALAKPEKLSDPNKDGDRPMPIGQLGTITKGKEDEPPSYPVPAPVLAADDEEEADQANADIPEHEILEPSEPHDAAGSNLGGTQKMTRLNPAMHLTRDNTGATTQLDATIDTDGTEGEEGVGDGEEGLGDSPEIEGVETGDTGDESDPSMSFADLNLEGDSRAKNQRWRFEDLLWHARQFLNRVVTPSPNKERAVFLATVGREHEKGTGAHLVVPPEFNEKNTINWTRIAIGTLAAVGIAVAGTTWFLTKDNRLVTDNSGVADKKKDDTNPDTPPNNSDRIEPIPSSSNSETGIDNKTSQEAEIQKPAYALPTDLEKITKDIENVIDKGNREAVAAIINEIDLDYFGTFENCDNLLAKGAADLCHFEPNKNWDREAWKKPEQSSQHPLDKIKRLLFENRQILEKAGGNKQALSLRRKMGAMLARIQRG